MSNLLQNIQNNPQETQRLLGIKYEQLEGLLKQAIKIHNNKQELAQSKKVRLIASGVDRPAKLLPSEQIILTLTNLLTFNNISTTLEFNLESVKPLPMIFLIIGGQSSENYYHQVY